MMLYIHLSFICFVKFVSIEDHESVGRTSWLYLASKNSSCGPQALFLSGEKKTQRVITRTYTVH